MCHSDTCRQNEHSISHYQAFMETSCQVETHRILTADAEKPSALTPKAKEIGCLLASALEGKENIYRGKHSN